MLNRPSKFRNPVPKFTRIPGLELLRLLTRKKRKVWSIDDKRVAIRALPVVVKQP